MKYLLSLLVLLSLASSAFAADIDFSRHIVDLDGKDIVSSKDTPPLDLATVTGQALLTEPPADPHNPNQGHDPADKLRRFALAVKVHKGGVVSLSAEEVSTLKAAIAAVYGPLVVGRAVEILDPVKP